MPNLVIIAPMNVELRPVAAALGLRRVETSGRSYRGTAGPFQVTALLGGVGPSVATSTTRRAIDEHHPDHVIIAGIAGGLDPTAAIGDLVVAAEAMLHGTDRVSTATPFGDVTPAGRIITTDAVLADTDLATQIASGCVAVDMETAAIGVCCDDAGVPWTAFRAISDRVGEGVVDASTLELLNADGTTNLGAVARRAIGNPAALRQLARMRRDGKAATAAVAVAVAAAVRHHTSG